MWYVIYGTSMGSYSLTRQEGTEHESFCHNPFLDKEAYAQCMFCSCGTKRRDESGTGHLL